MPDATRWQITLAFSGVASSLANLIVPAHLAVQYGSANVIGGVAIAVVYTSVIAGGMAYYAAKTRQKSIDLSRTMFGESGCAFPTAALCLISVGFAVFEGSIVATAASSVIPGLPYAAAAVAVAAACIPLSLGEVQTVLDRFNGALLPIYAIGIAALVGVAVSRCGSCDAWLHLGPAPQLDGSAWWCFSFYGSSALFGLIAMDFSYVGAPRDATFLAAVSFGLPMFALVQLANALVALFIVGVRGPVAATSETAVVDAAMDFISPAAAFIFIAVSQVGEGPATLYDAATTQRIRLPLQMRVNAANTYIATLNLHALLVMCKRRCAWRSPSPAHLKLAAGALVCATILTLMLWTDIFAALGTLLLIQGVLMTSWVGVAAAHVVQWAISRPVAEMQDLGDEVRNVGDTSLASAAPEWRWIGLCAWLCGVAAGLALLVGSGGEDGGTTLAASLSPFVSMALSAAVAVACPVLVSTCEQCVRARAGTVLLKVDDDGGGPDGVIKSTSQSYQEAAVGSEGPLL